MIPFKTNEKQLKNIIHKTVEEFFPEVPRQIEKPPQIIQNTPDNLSKALSYYYGLNVEKDLSTARKYLEKGRAERNSEAIALLAHMSHSGIGCRIDMFQAFDLYKEASDLGHPNSFFM